MTVVPSHATNKWQNNATTCLLQARYPKSELHVALFQQFLLFQFTASVLTFITPCDRNVISYTLTQTVTLLYKSVKSNMHLFALCLGFLMAVLSHMI